MGGYESVERKKERKREGIMDKENERGVEVTPIRIDKDERTFCAVQKDMLHVTLGTCVCANRQDST